MADMEQFNITAEHATPADHSTSASHPLWRIWNWIKQSRDYIPGWRPITTRKQILLTALFSGLVFLLMLLIGICINRSLINGMSRDIKPTATSSRFKARDWREVLVAIGGTQKEDGQTHLKSVEFLDPTDPVAKWRSLTSLQIPRDDSVAVVWQSYIYVIGGDPSKFDPGPGPLYRRPPQPLDSTLKSVERFDPYTLSWQRMADMITPRDDHCGVLLNDMIYVAGGAHGNKAEKYDPLADEWDAIADLITVRHGHACAAYDGEMWAFGGQSAALDVFAEKYSPATGIWERVDVSRLAETYFSIVSTGSQFYAIGTGRVDVITDPATDSWTPSESQQLSPTRKYPAAAYHETSESIYVVGGYDTCGVETEQLSVVENKRGWQPLSDNSTEMRHPRGEHCLVAVWLPV